MAYGFPANTKDVKAASEYQLNVAPASPLAAKGVIAPEQKETGPLYVGGFKLAKHGLNSDVLLLASVAVAVWIPQPE